MGAMVGDRASGGLDVALLDPSLFTLPYDEALADALAAAGMRPVLFGRPLRAGETRLGASRFEPAFYRRAERLYGRLPSAALRLAKGGGHVAGLLAVRRRLAAAPPAIIHFQWAPLPLVDRWLVPAFRAIAPTLLTVHDPKPFNGSARGALQALGATALLGAFDRLIVHTAAGKAQLVAAGVPDARIAVIPHGVLRLGATVPAVRRAGESVVLLFGRLKPYKGLDQLIEAFAALPEELRGRARLRIVGEPYMPIEPLVERARALGIAGRIDWDLRFVGEAEVPGLIAGADILAFPYRDIDASGVLMASLPFGKPILASRLGAFAEVLREGVHGRLVPPGDPLALAEGLAKLLADPAGAARMGDNVRALAADLPSWAEIAGRTTALYRTLIAERAATGSRKAAIGTTERAPQLRP